MYSEPVTRLRGILIVFIASLFVVAPTVVGLSSPINVKFTGPEFIRGIEKILPHSLGSGVVINPGVVLTAFHNIEFPTEGCGTWYTDVKVLAYSPKKDICVIKYPTEGQKFSRLAPEPPKVGDRVVLNGRRGTYYGTWAVNPHDDDVMSIKFDGQRAKIGDSGGGVYNEHGLVGIFLGYTGWIDGPKGEASYVCPWADLKAFGIPVSGQKAVKPNTDELLPLPGTEDGKTSPQSGTEEVPPKTTAKEPKKEVNNVTGHATPRSTTTDEEHHDPATPDPKPKGRRGSSGNHDGQGPRSGNEKSRNLKPGTSPEPHAGKGASLPPTPSKKGSGSSSKGSAMEEMLITTALGAAGITATGGTGVAVYFGAKVLIALYRRRKKKSRKSDTSINTLSDQIEEVLGRKPTGFLAPHIPGRKVDEIGELLQLAQLEGYDPLMGSTFGLFMQDEINQLLSRPEISEEQKDIVRKLYNSTMDRLNSAAPLVKGQ